MQNGNHEDNVTTVKQSQAVIIKQILGLWLNRAKETLYLQNLIKDIRVVKTLSYCQQCTIDVELNVPSLSYRSSPRRNPSLN